MELKGKTLQEMVLAVIVVRFALLLFNMGVVIDVYAVKTFELIVFATVNEGEVLIHTPLVEFQVYEILLITAT